MMLCGVSLVFFSKVCVVFWVKELLELMVMMFCFGFSILLLLVMINEIFLLVIESIVFRWCRVWLEC